MLDNKKTNEIYNILNSTKQPRVTISNSAPSNKVGDNGSIHLAILPTGPKLFVKNKNQWYHTDLSNQSISRQQSAKLTSNQKGIKNIKDANDVQIINGDIYFVNDNNDLIQITYNDHLAPTEQTRIQVRNDEGSIIPAGAPIYSKGEIGGSERILVGICDANDPNKMPCIGIAFEEMNTTSTKDNFAVVSGVYNKTLTGYSGVNEGDVIYVSDTSGLTLTKPTAPDCLIQNVGIVIRANTPAGQIQGMLVSAIGRTNDIPNELVVNYIANATTDTDKFLVSDSGTIKYRTGAEILSDLGIAADEIIDWTVDQGATNIHASNIEITHNQVTDFDSEVNALAQVKIDALIDSAPLALDTLNELAAALGDDENFATTVTNSIATKVGLTGDETVAGVKTFSSALDLTGVSSDPGDDNTVRIGATSGYDTEIFQINSNDGWVKIGPYNESWSHFVTDRARYYFNKEITIDTGIVSSYNEDLILRRTYDDSTYNQITIGDDSFELKLDNTARLSVDGSGNVGIGTASPIAPLHIATTNTDTDNNLGDLSNPRAGILINNLSTNANTYAAIDFRAGTHDARIAVTNGDTNVGNMNFIVDNGNSPIVGMALTSLGKVGIGTESPQTHLDVFHTSAPEIAITGDADNVGVLGFGDNASYKSGRIEYDHASNFFTMDVAGIERFKLTSSTMTPDVDINLTSGHTYKIAGTSVLSNNTLGSGVTASSLTSVGTLGSLTVSGDATFDTSTLKVDSSNNRVGIGTTSPSRELHIYRNNIYAAVEIQGSTKSLYMGGNWGIGYTTSTDLEFKINNSTQMIIDSGARVGIGTTSPSVKLDVEESSVSALIDIHQSASGTGTDSGIRFQKNSNLKGTVGYNAGTDTVNLNYGAFDNTHLNIDSSGNVGIGTASPAVNLHVKDDSGSNTLETIRVENSNGYAELGAQSTYVRLLAGGSLTYAANSSASYFYIGGLGKMGLTSTGLGIGNTSPSEALDVTGNIAVTGTVDGVDIAARDAVLTSTTTTANAALPKAGGTITGDLTVDGDLTVNGGDMLFDNLTTSKALIVKASDDESAAIELHADDASDNQDKWQIEAHKDDGDLYFYNMTSGSWAQKFRVTDTGNAVVNNALFIGSVPSGDGSSENVLVYDSGTSRVENRTYAELRSDLGIADNEIIDWTIDQGSTNIDPGNYTDTNTNQLTTFVAEDGDGTEVTISHGKQLKFVEAGGININFTDTDSGADGDEFDLSFNVYTAQTSITSILNSSLVIGRDSTDQIDFSSDNQIRFKVGNANEIILNVNSLYPAVNDGTALGGTSNNYSDLYLASGGTINWNNGDIVATHSSNVLGITGGNVGIGTTSPSTPLHIYKSITDNADNSLLTIQGDRTTDSADLGTEKILIDFTMTDSNANNYPQVKIGAAVGRNENADTVEKEGSGAFVIYTSGGDSSVDGEDNTAERMRVDYQGNVGIGNTSPNHLLHVGDDATASFTTNPDKAIQLSSTTNDEEIAYILYSAEGANNIRSKYFIDDAIQWVGWDSTYSSGLYGYKWQIVGNDKMALTTSGNLGIGTTSPDYLLEVEGSDDIYTQIKSTGSNSDAGLKIKNDAQEWRIYNWGATSDVLNFRAETAGNSVLTMQTDGNVGIGTTSPSKKLDVNGNIGSNGDIFIPSGNALQLADVTDHTKIERSTGLQFYTNSAPRLNILDSGNVGIGTTSPVAALTVKSNSTSSANSGFTLMDNSNTNAVVQIGEKSTDGGRLHMYDGGILKVSLYTDGTDNFINAGNVGIGTTSPDSPLHVQGAGDTSSTKSFEVDDSGGTNLFYIRDDGMVSITHSYLFVQASGGIYSTGSIKARGGVTHDLGDLGLGSDGNVDHMTISSGNVGIGNTSPSTTLHLGSSSATATKILVEASDTDTGYDGLEIKRKYPRIKLNDTDGTDNSMYIWHLGNQLRFGSDAGSASDASFVIKDGIAADSFFNGNVGIGASSPSEALDVSGNANVSGTVTCATINTGQGATEVYAMNQDVASTDAVEFTGLTMTGNSIASAAGDDKLIHITQTLNDSSSAAGGQLYSTIKADITAYDLTGWDETYFLNLRSKTDGPAFVDRFQVDLSGNVVTGTWQGTAIGASYVATLNQDTTGNAATATEATNVTVSANNTTDETVYPLFVDGATGTQGCETDTALTYNPSSGQLTTSILAGDIKVGGHTFDDIDIAGEFTDSDSHIMSSAAIQDQFPGTVTNVTGGEGIDVSAGTSTPSIVLNLEEVADGTGDINGAADEIIYLDVNTGAGTKTQKRKQVNEWKISQFNIDTFYDVKIHQWYSADALNDYIPFGASQLENSSTADFQNDDTLFIAPYDGELQKIVLQAATGANPLPGNTRILLRVNGVNGSFVQVSVGSESTATFTFTTGNTFSAGDRLRISFDPVSTPYYVTATSVWKYTL